MNGFTKQTTSKICLILNELGNALKGRLPSSTVEFALNYIPHNEFGLAFETLCDYIDEFIVNMLYFSYGVDSPCRTICTACGSPPCMKNKSY